MKLNKKEQALIDKANEILKTKRLYLMQMTLSELTVGRALMFIEIVKRIPEKRNTDLFIRFVFFILVSSSGFYRCEIPIGKCN